MDPTVRWYSTEEYERESLIRLPEWTGVGRGTPARPPLSPPHVSRNVCFFSRLHPIG